MNVDQCRKLREWGMPQPDKYQDPEGRGEWYVEMDCGSHEIWSTNDVYGHCPKPLGAGIVYIPNLEDLLDFAESKVREFYDDPGLGPRVVLDYVLGDYAASLGEWFAANIEVRAPTRKDAVYNLIAKMME